MSSFISRNGIKVISESEFLANDTTTNVELNEYVLFEQTGVYMQIIDRGCGQVLKNGETARVLVRYTERNVLGDSLQMSNNTFATHHSLDKFGVTNNSGTFYASFESGGTLQSAYGSASVPAGWLVPLTYIRLGRPVTADDRIARVKIIVPHDQGHSYASSGVYPCLYDITYMIGEY